MRFYHGGVAGDNLEHLYEVDYEHYASVALPVTSGEQTVKVQMDSPFLSLGIDTTGNITPVSENLVLNAPLWQTESDNATFTTIDSTEHACTVSGAVWTLNEGYDFNSAASNYIDLGADAALMPTGAISYGVWAYVDEAAYPLANHYAALSEGRGDTWLFVRANGAPEFVCYDTSGNTYAALGAANDVPVQTNTYIVGTFTDNGDGTGTARVYVDGDLKGSDSDTFDGTLNHDDPPDLGRRVFGGGENFFNGVIGEAHIYSVALTDAEVLQNYNATKAKYNTGDIDTYSTLTSVPDNANNIILMSNVTPYLNSYNAYVGGVLQVRYEPNDIILTTVLPDRQGGDHPGAITWGDNPASVRATVGSMSSSGQPSIGAASDTSTSDLLPVVGGTDWRPDAGVSATLQSNPLRPIVVAISDNTTLSEYQVWVWLGIILVIFVTVLVGANVRGHHLITGIAMAATIILLVVLTIFPMLTIIIAVVVILGGLVSERSPAL
jgi:hypothetical protein